MHIPSGIQCKASLLSLSVSEASAPCWSWNIETKRKAKLTYKLQMNELVKCDLTVVLHSVNELKGYYKISFLVFKQLSQ